MLEVHRLRHIEWGPTAVVALATSRNGTAVAAARDSGAIEIWNVAPGSVGWHCEVTIPGRNDAAISSLVWCNSFIQERGRLFSAGLDGFITEWDLTSLQPKGAQDSYGGPVWDLAAEPLDVASTSKANGTFSHIMETGKRKAERDDNESSDEDEVQIKHDKVLMAGQQRLAVACDDGCVRLFAVKDNDECMAFLKAFPRVKGRILSVAWTLDSARIYAGGSDGCIRCWDTKRYYEVHRITAGIGGIGNDADLCIWSLLVLRDGTVVSGDSSGSTQFWEGRRGTLLQAYTHHRADVLTLAAAPSHNSVFSGGADGQVVLYQFVNQSTRYMDSNSASESVSASGQWTLVGKRQTHTHDVRALAVAYPVALEEGYEPPQKVFKQGYKRSRKQKHVRWTVPGIPMLVSAGNDSKLFAYPADSFLKFSPHDICPAPERVHIQLAPSAFGGSDVLMMAQHHTHIDIWKIYAYSKSELVMGDTCASSQRRKFEACNGGSEIQKDSFLNGSIPAKSLGKLKGSPPSLLARIKSKAKEHILCSAVSQNGKFVAFSDRLRCRLFELQGNAAQQKPWTIRKKSLPRDLPATNQMLFTIDSTRIILVSPSSKITVVDIQSTETVYTYEIASDQPSPITILCVSPDGQWLAISSALGHITILNLETFRLHWSVPLLDGTPTTAAVFRPGNHGILIVSTVANQIHVLDVEARELGEWSKLNKAHIPQEILEFPGGIFGLSVPSSDKSTSVIAYGSRAMCHIDFSKPVKHLSNGGMSNGTMSNGGISYSPGKESPVKHENGQLVHANGNTRKNFVLTKFKDPVLFVSHVQDQALIIVERPWLEVLRQFPAPVYRHVFGT